MAQQTNKIVLSYKNISQKNIGEFLLKKEFSPGNIFNLIKNKNVKINGIIAVDKNHKIKFLDKIEITLNDEVSDLPFTKKDINIKYEDEYFIIVNKESNVDVEPTKSNYDDNLACYVNNYFKENNILSKIHLVNRLDKLTSGLVIIAKNQYIHNLFSKTKITKKYKALVSGIVNNKGTIKIKIAKEENSIKRIVSENGKLSITKYKKEKIINNNSLVDIKLLTGRTHQIRLSFSSISHPLVGDPLYGFGNESMYLKAYYLSFKHPITKRKIIVKED